MADLTIADTGTVTIAGAGLAGSLLAVYLARRGFRVEVFERWGDPRKQDVPAGRSINLALAERGIHALRQVGLHHRVGQFALPMRGRMVHDLEGDVSLQPYGQRAGEVIYSVHRARLNLALIEAAEATDRVRIHFNQEIESIDFEAGTATFRDQASDRQYDRPVFPLVGADGAGSVVRTMLERHLDFEATSDLLDHGYRELTIPPADEGFRMDPEALHIWPRGGYMMIALPNADRSFTVTLFMPNEGDPSFATLQDFPSFESFIRSRFPDTLDLLDQLETDFAENPVGVLGTIRCDHWHLDGRVAILGDAAHAVVPFHGQGMNCAFEDCAELDRIIGASTRWDEAFAAFEADRKPNANAIADMALENYVEMRASVVDPEYLLKRALALELERRHPTRFVPRYSLVMFRRIPYAQAQRRGRINAGILTELVQGRESVDEVDFDAAERLIEERLDPLPAPAPISLS
ncbi:MAG: NAD(P)/FAD-dependent oxidoreductase [Xanthomonadales bacterium]|nr:NAD(P)/FAD-dependent oxidoreductase [Xanthomonadales bacterium]